MLEHSNGWHRETAMRLLFESLAEGAMSPSVVEALEELVRSSQRAEAVVRALQCLHAADALHTTLLQAGLGHRAAAVRYAALRLAEAYLEQEAVRNSIQAAIADEVDWVRLQAALSLGELPEKDRVAPLTRLARRDAADARVRHAILCSADEVWGELALALGEIPKADRPPGLEKLTAELWRQLGRSGQSLASVVHHLGDRAGGGDDQGYLLRGLEVRGEDLVTALSRRGVARAAEVYQRILEHADTVARDTALPMARRAAAVDWFTLAPREVPPPALSALLAWQQPPRIRAAAVQAALLFDDEATTERLLAALPSLPPTLRNQVLESMTRRTQSARRLLGHLLSDATLAATIPVNHRQALRQHSDGEVADRAEQLWGAVEPRAEVVRRLHGVLDATGSSSRGKPLLFVRHCGSCHRREVSDRRASGARFGAAE